MANTIEYAVSKGFNKNIFIERDEAGIDEYDVSKFGMGFFPGNEVLVPGAPDIPPTPVGNPYLTFSSAESFSISTTNASKSWDGTLEYSTDTENWTEWDGTEVNSSEDGKLYFRGSNNTTISVVYLSEFEANPWILNGNAISCNGNIETLLDYQTVMNGEHPQMGAGCYLKMFQSCTSLTASPELPATTLTEGCYNSMFIGCSLTTVPELPATTLANYCYANIFRGCVSIKLSETQDTDYTTPYRIPKEGEGIDAHNTMYSMFEETGGTFTGDPTINTTYYLHKDNHVV